MGRSSDCLRLQVLLQNCVVVADAIDAESVVIFSTEARQAVQSSGYLIQTDEFVLCFGDLLLKDHKGLSHKLVGHVF